MLERQGLVALASSMLAFTAAAEAPAKGPTVGFMHAIHATNDVSKTLEFYTDVFGPQGKIQPFTNEGVPLLTNSPGAKLRISMLGFDLAVPAKSAADPAPTDLLGVPKSATVRTAACPFQDEALVHWSDTVRSVFVKDPNGLNLELVGTVGQ